MKTFLVLLLIIIASSCNRSEEKSEPVREKNKLRALIVDGQNNHGVWPKTTVMMKKYLEETKLFEVDVYRSKYTYQGPHHGKVDNLDHKSITQLLERYNIEDTRIHIPTDSITADPGFTPEFDKYDVVISNFGWQSSDWAPEVKESFENFVRNGGGLVVVHAANNAWGDWTEFNKMIGVGGWGDRPLEVGFQLYYDEDGNLQREPSNGEESSHGPEVEFLITTRAPAHPIMKGLPRQWLHSKDELYDRLRGPASDVTVLATAYSGIEENSQPWAPENKGSGRHEPLLMTITYGKGRTFHTALGHMDYSMESVGFIATFQRGTEWAATGGVTQEIPKDFPDEKKSSGRPWKLN